MPTISLDPRSRIQIWDPIALSISSSGSIRVAIVASKTENFKAPNVCSSNDRQGVDEDKTEAECENGTWDGSVQVQQMCIIVVRLFSHLELRVHARPNRCQRDTTVPRVLLD